LNVFPESVVTVSISPTVTFPPFKIIVNYSLPVSPKESAS
jgi:hypothetical protein